MLQLCPRGEHGVKVLTVPFGCEHEVRHVQLRIAVAQGTERAHPLGGDGLVPVDLLHALLHLQERGLEAFPLVLLVHEDLLGLRHDHRCEEVETLRCSALSGLAVVVDHLLKHFGIGLVALGHDIDLVVAGPFVFRTDTRLLVADLVELGGDLGDGLVVVDEVFHLQTGLIDLGHHLCQTKVVGLAHEVGDEVVQYLVVLLRLLVEFQRTGLLHGGQYLVVVLQSEGGGLQPHHTTEVTLELLAAGIVTTRTEEAVGELHLLVVLHEIAGAVLGSHDFLNFLDVDGTFLRAVDIIASEQLVGDVVESDIVLGYLVDLIVEARPPFHIVQQLVHVAGESNHQGQQLVLLQLAQHAVEIEMIELQVEVGGHEAGEVGIVVLLVDLEELVQVGGHDAETVFAQLLAELRVELLELRGVGEVQHVDTQTWSNLEVLLFELVLTLLHAFDEGFLLIGVLHDVCLVDHAIVEIIERLIVLALELVVGHVVVKGPHQRVVPRGGQIDVADVGILEGEATLRCRCIAERTDIGQRETADIHVVVDAVEQFLHVDLRRRYLHDGLLFLCTAQNEGYRAG